MVPPLRTSNYLPNDGIVCLIQLGISVTTGWYFGKGDIPEFAFFG